MLRPIGFGVPAPPEQPTALSENHDGQRGEAADQRAGNQRNHGSVGCLADGRFDDGALCSISNTEPGLFEMGRGCE